MSGPLDEAEAASARGWCEGAPVEVHPRIGSTNDRIQELAAAGAPQGTLVVAALQEAGRGRLGRTWVSPPGGLYFSFLLRPAEATLARVPATLLGGLAVCQAIEECAPEGPRPELKWPNDVHLAGRKVAGVLGEMQRGPDGYRLALGVGINLAADPAERDPGLREIATTLGEGVAPAAVLRAFFAAFRELYARVEAGREAEVLTQAAARMPLIGQPVRVRLPQRTRTGVFSALSETGGLVLVEPDGERAVLLAGEVEGVRAP